mmetsp:Transcript_30675/g.64308  ORF Transcript_30675/g.64308 Transcript_30675/m.64308 type:complete len:421 (-) Transcript_30675:3180-4442(-)
MAVCVFVTASIGNSGRFRWWLAVEEEDEEEPPPTAHVQTRVSRQRDPSHGGRTTGRYPMYLRAAAVASAVAECSVVDFRVVLVPCGIVETRTVVVCRGSSYYMPYMREDRSPASVSFWTVTFRQTVRVLLGNHGFPPPVLREHQPDGFLVPPAELQRRVECVAGRLPVDLPDLFGVGRPATAPLVFLLVVDHQAGLDLVVLPGQDHFPGDRFEAAGRLVVVVLEVGSELAAGHDFFHRRDDLFLHRVVLVVVVPRRAGGVVPGIGVLARRLVPGVAVVVVQVQVVVVVLVQREGHVHRGAGRVEGANGGVSREAHRSRAAVVSAAVPPARDAAADLCAEALFSGRPAAVAPPPAVALGDAPFRAVPPLPLGAHVGGGKKERPEDVSAPPVVLLAVVAVSVEDAFAVVVVAVAIAVDGRVR